MKFFRSFSVICSFSYLIEGYHDYLATLSEQGSSSDLESSAAAAAYLSDLLRAFFLVAAEIGSYSSSGAMFSPCIRSTTS